MIRPGNSGSRSGGSIQTALARNGTQETTMKFTGKTQAEVDSAASTIALEICRRKRLSAYREESDPIFFDYQRGEATQSEWLAKVAEIKARFPKP